MSAATRTQDTPPSAAVADATTETEVCVWQMHRLREEPERIPLIAGAFAGTVAVWWLIFPQVLLLPVPVLCLTIALNDFLFPLRCRLTDKGAHSDCGLSRLFIPWTEVKRATKGNDGIYLSPFARPSRLEAFRGVRLRFAGNADEVTATVKQLWRGMDAPPASQNGEENP